jgi:cell division protein FtsQ
VSDRVETTGRRSASVVEPDETLDQPVEPGVSVVDGGGAVDRLDREGPTDRVDPGENTESAVRGAAQDDVVHGAAVAVAAAQPAERAEPAGPAGPADRVDRVPPPVEPRLWLRRMEVLREQGRRRLRWVIAALVAVVVAAAILVTLHSPVLAVRHVTVVGAHQTPVGAVVGQAGLDGRPLVDIDTGAAAARVESLPWVAHASVVRSWPTGVTITVVERVPRAAVDRPGGVAVVDGSGHVLEWAPESPPGLPSLGAVVVPGPPGSVLGPGARPALTVVDAFPASLAPTVRRVVMPKGRGAWLDLGGGLSAALGGTGEISAKLQSLVSVLASARPAGSAVIDVTVPDLPTVGPPKPGAPPWRRAG